MGVPLTGYDGMLDRLIYERARLSYSQSEMGSVVGISKSNYCKCEKGNRRIGFAELRRLSAHGVDINFVITGKRLKRRELQKLKDIDYGSAVGCYLIACSASLINKDAFTKAKWQRIRSYMKAGILYQASMSDINYWKLIREICSITQPEMAQKIGVDVKKLRNMEYGRKRPDNEILFKLYTNLLISPAFILRDPQGILCELECFLYEIGDPIAENVLKLLNYTSVYDEKSTNS